MNILNKILTLNKGTQFEICTASKARKHYIDNGIKNTILYNSIRSDGEKCVLFKTLFTNACSFDCKYCQNSVKCGKIETFKADELAKTFITLYRKKYVQGLFLSSGIPKDPDFITEQMLESVRLIRNKYNFKGYVHFKILPGTNYELIKQAAELADRLSVNLEAPSKLRLEELSSVKIFKNDILKRQAWIKNIIKNKRISQTTQMVVGAADETDLEILRMVDWEYKNMNLNRVYFSAFFPIPKTALENKEQVSLEREHYLYCIDSMLRLYNMKLKEFEPIFKDGMLPMEDPKMALAKLNFEKPIEVNEASYDELIKVPGIGVKSVKRILSLRKKQRIKKYSELSKIGVVVKRAKPFIKVDGKTQLSLKKFVKG